MTTAFHFTMFLSMHASLHQRYSLGAGDFVDVGTPGTYAPEDPETGAEYRCLGDAVTEGRRRGKVCHSSDYKPGLFYPENTFIGGQDDDGEPLPFEILEAFAKKIRYSRTRRVLLPRGYHKGQMTWETALMYSPIEWRPSWSQVPKILQTTFPKGVFDDNGRAVHINGIQPEELNELASPAQV